MNRNKLRTLETYDFYLRYLKSKTSKIFKTKEEVKSHLQREVFSRVEFTNHVSEVSKSLGNSYDVTYTVITNYLIDVLYEIDIAQAKPKKKTRIIIQGYLMFDIGFIYPLRGKRFYLRKFLNNFIKEQRLINNKQLKI